MSNRKKLRATQRKLERHAAREAAAAEQMTAIRDTWVAAGMDPATADATMAVFARRRAAGLPLTGPEADAERLAAIAPAIRRLEGAGEAQ